MDAMVALGNSSHNNHSIGLNDPHIKEKVIKISCLTKTKPTNPIPEMP